MSPVKAFDLEPPVISIMTVFYQNFSKVNPTVNLSSKSSGELTFENFTCPSQPAAGANIGWHDWGKPFLEMVSVKL